MAMFNQSANHVMLDIETMSRLPDAAVVAVGAVAFNPYQLDPPTEAHLREHSFFVTISLESNEAAGRRIDANTVTWWLKQSKDAQAGLFADPHTNLRHALVQFRLWVQNLQPRPTHLWANDPDFDAVILRSAFDQLGEAWPFQYWQTRSVRTIKELAYPEDDAPDIKIGVHHNAVDDAIKQALLVWHAHQTIFARRKQSHATES